MIVVGPDAQLLEVVLAAHTVSRFANFLHGRQEQADEHRDDRNDHQQFDQGESRPPHTMSSLERSFVEKWSKRSLQGQPLNSGLIDCLLIVPLATTQRNRIMGKCGLVGSPGNASGCCLVEYGIG